jgi:hypothetical protein
MVSVFHSFSALGIVPMETSVFTGLAPSLVYLSSVFAQVAAIVKMATATSVLFTG